MSGATISSGYSNGKTDAVTEFTATRYLNNTGKGGNVYIDEGATFNMTGGTITAGTARNTNTAASTGNAITENGELYNVDGTCNRVSALLYGPKSVIIIAGKNKIVKDLGEAVIRVKTLAAPPNCKRLNKQTYCAKTGQCVAIGRADEKEMTSGCNSPDRICRSFVVCGPQVFKNRIKVILVNEDLGY
jgi:hypothetical protein